MRLVFMGSPVFARVVLEALLSSAHDVVGVYAQPPRPSGRGYRLHPTPVQQLALEKGIDVFTPSTLKTPDALHTFQALKPDVAIVAAYGLLLPQTILDVPREGCLNVHASLLPRWRGAAPIQRALLAGDGETGITIMQMEVGLDTGPILLQEAVTIAQGMTGAALHDQLATLGAQVILQALDHLERGTLKKCPQPQEGVTYAKKLSKAEGLLDWTQPADVLARRVRALTPWPGTYFMREGVPYRVRAVEVVPSDSLETPEQPGTLLDDYLTIQCGQGALRLKRLQRPGKEDLSAEDFLKGMPLRKGMMIEGTSVERESGSLGK